jgi:hypothetical protein
MKWQAIARSIGLIGLGCFGMMGLPALAQTNPAPTGLNAELSQAVCQQDWARAIRIVDRMRPLTPEARRGELTVYRSRLHAMLTSGTTIPNLQCGAASSPPPAATPRPSPAMTTSSSQANNPAPNQASSAANDIDTTIRGVRPTSNSSNSSGSSGNGSTPATGTNNIIDRARNLNQTINNP